MGENKEEKKLSYDELKNIAGQLQQQNAFMREQLLKSRNEEMYKRIDYLFKVLENSKMFDVEFVANVALEITQILTIQEEQEVKE